MIVKTPSSTDVKRKSRNNILVAKLLKHLHLVITGQNTESKHSDNRLVIPATKYFISDKKSNDKVLRIFIHEDFCPDYYFDPSYNGIILDFDDTRYYEFIGGANLFVKKNVRVENHIKNALEKYSINNNETLSKSVRNAIKKELKRKLDLHSHAKYLRQQITIYLTMGEYLKIIRYLNEPRGKFSKLIRNVLYRSLGLTRTEDFDNRPSNRSSKNVA